jgi:hypothetical protein
MKKILLISGSSFSFEHRDLEPEEAKIKKWPTLLSEKLDLTLINKSKPAASNLYIFDHLMENILKLENEIELVVAPWSYAFKTSIFRDYELNFINEDDQDCYAEELSDQFKIIRDKILSDNNLINSIDQTLRHMIYVQDACNKRNITCIHYPLLNIFKTGLEETKHIKMLERIVDLENFKIISGFTNTLGWPSDRFLGGYTYNTKYSEYIISDMDHHPNKKGHELISSDVYNKYLEMVGKQND